MVRRQRGGQMIQDGIKNKYGLDIQVSAADIRPIKSSSSGRDVFD
jgi:hypothetical protein